MTEDTPLTADELMQFTGTENWYRHSMVRTITYTDGVKYMAERAGAYWLLDEIAIANSAVGIIDIKKEEFQVWKLRRDAKGHGATLSVEDGNGNEVYSKRIEFTDFPLPGIDLWFSNETILLPSEY